MNRKKIAVLTFFLVYSLNAFSYGAGLCVTFADGHSECMSDVDTNGEMALELKKRASDSFKALEAAKMNKTKTNKTNEGNNYIDRAKESAIDLLIKSSQQYREGLITKDQYIQLALQVSQMADYANKSSDTAPQVEPSKSTEVKLVDKKAKVSDTIPFGSPDIDNYSDEQLIKYENKEKDIPLLRTKFKNLQNMQKNLALSEVNLKCAGDMDCVFLPVGHKICGGPVSYLLISKLDSNFSSVNDKLDKFSDEDGDFQKLLHGFAGLCDYSMPPKSTCRTNECVAL